MSWAYAQRNLLGVSEVGVIGFGAKRPHGLRKRGSVPVLGIELELRYVRRIQDAPSNLKLIVENEGTNDLSSSSASVTSAETAWLNAVESAAPNIPIVVMRPFDGSQAAAVQDGIAACTNPSLVHWMDTTGFFNTAYGADPLNLHPSGANDLGFIGPQVAAQLAPILYPKGRSYSFF